MGNCLSKDSMENGEELLKTAAQVVVEHAGNKDEKPAATPPREPKNLLSDRPDMDLKKEDYDSDKAIAALDMGIEVIDLFQKAAKVAELVIPSPLGDVLEKVTSVLGVLKKMVQNRQAWATLLGTIDEHQKTFNDQLERLKADDMVPDPESPLLAPVRQYSDTLEKLAAKIMAEGGLVSKNAPDTPLWEKVKKFTSRALSADSEKGSMDGYTNQLSEAMNQFRFTLELFVSFRVESIKVGVDSLASDFKGVKQDLKEIRDIAIENGEPKDTINTVPMSAFGTQHRICLEGTRLDVLQEIRTWASAENATPIYCIGDVAGTGKSTISQTMYQEWLTKDQNPLGFFFSQAGSSVGNATDFCFSIGQQIREISGADQEGYWKNIDKTSASLRGRGERWQWTKLVQEPLSKLPASEKHVLLIDALDECTVATRKTLLECLFAAYAAGALPNIRVFITTRNEPDILKFLNDDKYGKFIIHKALRNSISAKADVVLYVNHQLDEDDVFVGDTKSRDLLVERCDGLFIFAFYACKLLKDAHGGSKPLEDILQEFTSLDSLYYKILSSADPVPHYTREPLRNILGVVAVAHEPLSISAISALLPDYKKSGLEKLKDVQTFVGQLGSILGSGGLDEPVYILHATFREFLLRQTRATTTGKRAENVYAISYALSNRSMSRCCLSILSKELTVHAGEMSSALKYAALFWVSHLTMDLHIQDLRQSMRKFFEEHLLNWIRVCATTNHLPECMMSLGQLRKSLEKLRGLKTQNIADDDLKWCSDTLDFLRSNQALLQASPETIYTSAIVFTASDNLVCRNYKPSIQAKLPPIILGHPTSESKSMILSGNIGSVSQVAYALGGELLTSASVDQAEQNGDIIVWDTETGAKITIYDLKGVLLACFGITFLPRNETVASFWISVGSEGGYDWKLYRLKVATGELVCPPQKLSGEGYPVCVAFAPDGTHVVCGTREGRIFDFSLSSGSLVGKVQQAHESRLNDLSFTPDGLSIISCAADWTFKIWTASSEGITGPNNVWSSGQSIIWGGSFSPVNPSLVAVTIGDELQIRNVLTGDIDFNFGWRNASDVTYSPDGEYIAVVGNNTTWISLAKLENGQAVNSRLETGHNLDICAFAFSPDKQHIVTGSKDQTLRIHNLADVGEVKAVEGHRYEVCSISFSLDGKRMASSDASGFICTWDLETGKILNTPLYGYLQLDNVIAYSSDGSIVASASMSCDLALWITETPAKHEVEVSFGYSPEDYPDINAIVFSPDDLALAFIAKATFDNGDREILCIKPLHDPVGTPVITVEHDLQPIPTRSSLAYHPSGEYICCGGQAWELAANPPAKLTGEKLISVLKETFPVPLEYRHDSEPLPSILFGSPVRETLYVPAELLAKSFGCSDGMIALGSQDGRLTVLDYRGHLTTEENALLARTRDIKRATPAKTDPSRIQELVFEKWSI